MSKIQALIIQKRKQTVQTPFDCQLNEHSSVVLIERARD